MRVLKIPQFRTIYFLMRTKLMNNVVSLSRKYSNILIFITLLLGSGVFSHLLTNEYSIDSGRKQTSLLAMLVLGLSYILSFGLILLYWQEFKKKMTPIFWLWAALMLWTMVSLLFGQLNVLTLLRLMGLYGCMLGGLMLFVCTASVRQVVMYLFGVCLIIIAINLAYIDWSVLSSISAKNIKGVHFQKNVFGQLTFLTIFISGFMFYRSIGWMKLLSLILMLIASWLLFLSTSMTSMLLVPITLFSIASSLIISRYHRGWLIVLGLSLFFTFVLSINWNEFFSLIGKSTTFTGRTNHWSEYWNLIEQSIVVGHGYGAIPGKKTYWLMYGAHNGYIESMYQTGGVGLLIILCIMGVSFRNYWSVVKQKKFIFDASFLLSFLVLYLILNLVEVYMLNRSGLYWPLFIYVTLQLAYLSKQNDFKSKTD